MERKGNQVSIKRVDSTGRKLKQSERQGPDGRYYFDVTIKGERFRTSADNLDSLREKEDRLYTLFTLHACDDPDLITVNDAFELWAEIKRGVRKNTLSNYMYLYRQYVRSSNIGRAELIDVKKSDVKKFYNRLAEKKGLSTSTIDGVHTVLRQVFQIAVDDGYLLVNPAEKALFELRRAHEHDREERHALTADEEARLLSFLETNREYGHWKNILVVLLETGMRIGELTSLVWQDIDFEHEMIHVQRTLAYYCRNGKTGYYMHPPKTRNSNRLIPMMGKTKEALLAEKQRQAEADNDSCMVIGGISDFVFLNRFGKVYHEGTVNRAIHRIVKASNAEIDAGKVDEKYRIRDFTAHCTRHTFATKAVESGMSIKAYQQILGHTDFQTSMDIYCHITDQMLMDAKSDYELFLEWREQHFKKKNENMEVKKMEMNENFVEEIKNEEIPETTDAVRIETEPLFEEYVDFDTFSKSDFRVVKVKECVAVKKSKKLLQFTLDDGTGTDRTILSGIHAYYEPEELVGKTLVAITNLPPRKMMGIDSCGMLLSAVHAENGEEALNLIIVDDKIPAGAKLY